MLLLWFSCRGPDCVPSIVYRCANIDGTLGGGQLGSPAIIGFSLATG